MNLQNVSIDTLKLFITVSDCGSINKASEQLFIDQSSISRKIKQLEQEIGSELFERTSKGVTLSAGGNLVYQFSRQLLIDFEKLSYSLEQINSNLSALRVGTYDSVSSHIYPEFFGKAMSTLKNVVITNNSDQLIKEFNNNELDAVLIDSEFSLQLLGDFQETQLFDEPFYAVYSLSNVQSSILENSLITAEDLKKLDILLYPKSCPIHKKITSTYTKQSDLPTIHQIRFASSAISFVQRTNLISILPKTVAINYVTRDMTHLGMYQLESQFNRHISLFAKHPKISDSLFNAGLTE